MSILVRLIVLAFAYKRRLALAWLCVLGAGAFLLINPKLVGWAIDFGIRTEHQNRIWVLLGASLAVLGAAGLRGMFAYGQQYLGEWLSQRVAYDLRNNIYDRLQRLSFAYHDSHQTGQLMSRATQDVEAVQRFIQMGAL
ncbi:MAG: ABC transporter transmembrane domain-containing protein, partial [Chloroflexota bacterium]